MGCFHIIVPTKQHLTSYYPTSPNVERIHILILICTLYLDLCFAASKSTLRFQDIMSLRPFMFASIATCDSVSIPANIWDICSNTAKGKDPWGKTGFTCILFLQGTTCHLNVSCQEILWFGRQFHPTHLPASQSGSASKGGVHDSPGRCSFGSDNGSTTFLKSYLPGNQQRKGDSLRSISVFQGERCC